MHTQSPYSSVHMRVKHDICYFPQFNALIITHVKNKGKNLAVMINTENISRYSMILCHFEQSDFDP